MGFVTDWTRDEGISGRAADRLRRAGADAAALDAAFAAARGGGRAWFVAEARDPNRCGDRLARRGLDIWQPRRTVTRPRRRGLAAAEIAVPLFPGYLFVHIPPTAPAFHAVLTEAASLLGQDGRPQPVADADIAALRGAVDHRVFDDTAPRRAARLEAALKAGGAVEIVNGPWAGCIARAVEGWRGGAVARLEAHLFGGMARITAPVSALRLVEAGGPA